MLSLFQVTCIVGLWKTAHNLETPMGLLNQAGSVVSSMPLHIGGKALSVPACGSTQVSKYQVTFRVKDASPLLRPAKRKALCPLQHYADLTH